MPPVILMGWVGNGQGDNVSLCLLLIKEYTTHYVSVIAGSQNRILTILFYGTILSKYRLSLRL
jgi:hypothetical protein